MVKTIRLLPRLISFFALTVFVSVGSAYAAGKKVNLDWNKDLPYTNGGHTTLNELAKGQDALLLDFWSSTCPCCMESMSVLEEYDESLPADKIRVVAINTDSMERAEKVRQELNSNVPWTYSDFDDYYYTALNIERVPCAVLITRDGRVLFQGHPRHPDLKVALDKWVNEES